MKELFADAKPSLKTVVKEKFILDTTAGFRMMWFNKKHPNCIYLDQRPECEPDIVGDFRNLKQFPDETFKLIVFDPNHRTIKDGYPLDRFEKCYGALLPETWQHDFKMAFAELIRVLQDYGILIFKWSTHKISVEEVLSCFSEKPLFGQQTSGTKGKRKSKTYWLTFMKIPEQTEASLSK